MLDLVPDPNQKPQVLLNDIVERAVRGVEALLQAPVVDRPVLCPLKSRAPWLPTSVFDLLLAVVRMEKIRSTR